MNGPAPTPVGVPGWLAEIKERAASLRWGEKHAEWKRLARTDIPALAAALEAVAALPEQWRAHDDGLPASALTEDRAWVREECAGDLEAAIESALRDAQGGAGGG